MFADGVNLNNKRGPWTILEKREHLACTSRPSPEDERACSYDLAGNASRHNMNVRIPNSHSDVTPLLLYYVTPLGSKGVGSG